MLTYRGEDRGRGEAGDGGLAGLLDLLDEGGLRGGAHHGGAVGGWRERRAGQRPLEERSGATRPRRSASQEHCASVASRELDTRAIGRRFGGRGRAPDRAEREADTQQACFGRASAASSPRVGLAPAPPARRRSLGSRRCCSHRLRLIGKNVRGVSRRERGRTACWCARRRAARRGRWWRRGKPSLRCLSCVEGEACADMKPPERAMGGRAFGKTRERSQLDSLPDFGRFPTL